jgi:hypothetical protein
MAISSRGNRRRQLKRSSERGKVARLNLLDNTLWPLALSRRRLIFFGRDWDCFRRATTRDSGAPYRGLLKARARFGDDVVDLVGPFPSAEAVLKIIPSPDGILRRPLAFDRLDNVADAFGVGCRRQGGGGNQVAPLWAGIHWKKAPFVWRKQAV